MTSSQHLQVMPMCDDHEKRIAVLEQAVDTNQASIARVERKLDKLIWLIIVSILGVVSFMAKVLWDLAQFALKLK